MRPGLYREFPSVGDVTRSICFLLSCVDFVFLDAGGGCRATEILLLGAVAHHAGMRIGA